MLSLLTLAVSAYVVPESKQHRPMALLEVADNANRTIQVFPDKATCVEALTRFVEYRVAEAAKAAQHGKYLKGPFAYACYPDDTAPPAMPHQ
jgi:hypothetical protein